MTGGRLATRAVRGGAVAALLIASGCSDPLSVFQERESDLAKRLPAERVRSAPGLDVGQFRKPPAPEEKPTAESLAARAEQAGKGPVDAAPVVWTLEQTRALAVANNLDLKVSVIEPAIAAQLLAAERAKFDAVFRPSVNAFKTDRASSNSTSVTQVRGIDARADFDIPLRTGGTLTLGAVGGFTQADNPFVTLGDSYDTAISGSISLPLMRGSGRDVNTASIKIAGYQADIASAGTRLQITGILAEVERAYWRLTAVRQELEVRKQQFQLAKTLLERAQRRADAGDAPQIEVTRAQSGLASRVDGVIRAETAVLVQQRNLKRLVRDPAAPVDGGAMVTPNTPPELSEYDLPTQHLLQLAESNRMELLQGELQLLSDSLNIDLASDATRPVLNVLGQYNASGARDNAFDSIRQVNQLKYQSYSVGVEGVIPFSNGQAEAGLRRAILERMRTLGTRESRKETVKQEVLDAIDRVVSAWQRITAAQLATTLAIRTLEAESRQFDRGARTSTDVLDAATSLADAQSAEVLAIGDYRISLVDLAVATGTVLGSAGVNWEEVAPPPLSGDRWKGLRPAGEMPSMSDAPPVKEGAPNDPPAQ